MINIKYKKQNICLKFRYSKTKSVLSVEIDGKKIIKIILSREKLFYACLFVILSGIPIYLVIKTIM